MRGLQNSQQFHLLGSVFTELTHKHELSVYLFEDYDSKQSYLIINCVLYPIASVSVATITAEN